MSNETNKWYTITEEGKYKLMVKIDESELISIKTVNSEGVIAKISMWEDELADILTKVAQVINQQ